MDTLLTNRCFMRFEARAERITTKQIAETFVSVGPLLDLLDSRNNQIMYGRRGTGKTHALRYFQGLKNSQGDLAIYIDAQNIGSNGSIYSDTTLPLAERASRLLVDICTSVHAELMEIFTDPERGWSLAEAAPVLNRFVDSFIETRILGQTEQEESDKTNISTSSKVSLKGTFSSKPALSIGFADERGGSDETSKKTRVSGSEETWIDFAYFSRAIRALADFAGSKRLWVLIDEWTTIPADIQPYLADLLRRAMFSVPNITVKIAAIEHRAHFKVDREDESYIGFEVGADITAAINLDDYLVIDNNEVRAKTFFRNFISNHASSAAMEIGISLGSEDEIISSAFTQENVFAEFVRATKGVPRDAMYILSNAAQRAAANSITMPTIRAAAYAFFMTEKYNAIQTNKENRLLLDWIRDMVIGGRRTRAFLLPVSVDDSIINRLFDRRALHILNRNRSAAHRPGERFMVYKLDYGLYVDLASTDKYPIGLLVDDAIGGDIDFDVPLDDARSYRRAVLDLNEFYQKHPELVAADA